MEENLDLELTQEETQKKFIYKKDQKGNEYAVVNPDWRKQQIQKQFKFYLKYSKIPFDYWNLTLDKIKIDKLHISQATDFVNQIENKKTCLYIYSKANSTGKTTLACAIGQELIKKGYDCYFGFSYNIINTLLKTSGFNTEKLYNEQVYEERHRIFNSDILIIDDIFDENKSTYFTNSPHLIISEWYNLLWSYVSEGKKVILTSNVSVEEISNKYTKDLEKLIYRNFRVINLTDSIEDIRRDQL